MTHDIWTRWRSWYCSQSDNGVFPADTSLIHIFAALDLLNHADTLSLLSSDINQKDNKGKSVIYYAAANNARSTIGFLLDVHGNDLVLDVTDQDLLRFAVTKTNVKLLEKFLKHPDVEIKHSILIAAIDGRHWSAFELLKSYLGRRRAGKSKLRYWPSLLDQHGELLHHAVLSRNLNLIEFFLSNGADQLKPKE